VYFDKVQNETEGYTGYVDIPVGMIASSNQTLPVTIRFDYHYKDCDGNSAVTRLTFMLTDDLTSVIVTDSAGREKEVCRNLVAGVIDLAATFGFHTPLTSGLWFEKLNDSSYVEMLYGAADISDKNSGSLYTYRYDVSSAIDSGLCLVEARTAYFHLRIRDVAVANGEVKICASEYENPGISLDLFRYVPGLNDTSRIRPGEVVWMLAGDTVASPYLLSKGGNPPADTANIQYQFQYNVKTECGEFTGDLYVSVIDSFPAKLELRRKICYTDDYAKHIDLFEVLGYGGLTGNFELLATNPPGKTLDLTMFDPTTSVMNANAAFDESNNEEVYTFRYVKGVNDSACLPANADLRVIITVTKEHDKD
jgi:hypothetical protein